MFIENEYNMHVKYSEIVTYLSGNLYTMCVHYSEFGILNVCDENILKEKAKIIQNILFLFYPL